VAYKWTCVQINPIYGSDCGFQFNATSTQSIILSQLTVASTFNFSVTVANVYKQKSSTSAIISVVPKAIPSVSVGAVATKYNYDSKIILNGFIDARAGAWTTWSSPGLTLAGSLTPPVQAVSSGISTVQLALKANTLDPGVSYTFTFGATYGANASTIDAKASVVVVMNSAPIGGSFSISPSNGTALATSFFMRTFGWSDDPADYPLAYVIQSRISSTANAEVIKALDKKTFETAVLSQGLESLSYVITVEAVAYDSYLGASIAAPVSVMVLPFGYTTSSSASRRLSYQLQSSTSSLDELEGLSLSLLQYALQINDPQKMIQVISAASGTLNAVNCSVPIPCLYLNRQECSATPNTCGPCKSGGYIGTAVD
jgi:hypothetical protein